MTILALDDEKMALEVLSEAIKKADSSANVITFTSGIECLKYITENSCDTVFMDIEMRDINGIELAREIKNINEKVNIIFVTGYSEYMSPAFKLHASGYILKPVSVQAVKDELLNLRNPIIENNMNIIARTFGNFDIYANGNPLIFKRTKSKELLAYLIDCKGAGATKKEIAAILFPETEYNRKMEDYINKIYKEMKRVLKDANIEDLIVKERNYYAINPELIKCDRYEYDLENLETHKAYKGEYMKQYSWASYNG